MEIPMYDQSKLSELIRFARLDAGATAIDVVPPTRWIEGTPSLHRITTDIARPMEAKPGRGWYICFGIAVAAIATLV